MNDENQRFSLLSKNIFRQTEMFEEKNDKFKIV